MKLDAGVYRGAAMLRDTTAGCGPGLEQGRHHTPHEAGESLRPFAHLPLGSFPLILVASLYGGGCLADTSLPMPLEAG